MDTIATAAAGSAPAIDRTILAGCTGKGETSMKRSKILAAGAAAITMMSLQITPTSAQRYCQNELAPETDIDEGCTAPVGGPITKTNARFSSSAQAPDEKSEAAELIEAALANEPK
jgi:hypothetical protein